MPDGRIRAYRLWKRFRADRTTYALGDQLRRLSRRRDQERWRWALRDVTLEVEPGESLALIGANGSGKSTLLKILGGVMYPTAGRLEATGRIGMLIDVWTGLHHELTGRENLFLAGSLLGLRRSEVSARFDEIVEFAELQDAIDRQTKYYSTGMKMRLGFGVAAFLEPHVLLVDEILAVGDASFQQRCLNRMRTVLAQGTTLVFVSHDLAAVEATCTRGLWLEAGTCMHEGVVHDTLARYRHSVEERAEAAAGFLAGSLRLVKVIIDAGESRGELRAGGSAQITLVIEAGEPTPATISIGVSEGTAAPILVLDHRVHLRAGQTALRCSIATLPLPAGHFYLWAGGFDDHHDLLPWQPAAHFDITGPSLDPVPRGIVRLAPVYVDAGWETSFPS